MTDLDRRTFVRLLVRSGAALALAPAFIACSPEPHSHSGSSGGESEPGPLAIPRERPADWDAIAFNRARGNAGAIPQSYLPQINGPDGEVQHLGKHLPFVPELPAGTVPDGMLAIMWGDPSRGHARHPNAVRSDANGFQGHWYDWIEVRKATESEAQTARSSFAEWPSVAERQYAVLGGGDLTADSGKNTVYLVGLPEDVRAGDLVRIHAHCLTHGEYVDFLVVPG